jgi:hypothetical protein
MNLPKDPNSTMKAEFVLCLVLTLVAILIAIILVLCPCGGSEEQPNIPKMGVSSSIQ